MRQPHFHLVAARFAAQAPFAEVLAVVGQQPVAVLTHPGPCPANDLAGVKVGRHIGSDPDGTAAGETRKRNLFHRSSDKAVCESRVMQDFATADVDSVMQITATWCDNV
jgi:hypothetical protein